MNRIKKKHFMRRWVLVCAGSVLLAACSTVQPPKQNAVADSLWRPAPTTESGFDAEGRLAVKDEGKGSYANFAWQDMGGMQNLEVKTPLGNSVGVLCQDGMGVIAQDSAGRVVQAASVADLSERMLGFALPFDHLNQWVKGYWAVGEPYQLLPDGRLRQSGWVIERELNANRAAPKRVELSNTRFNIRLVFDEYGSTSAEANGVCALRQEEGH
ncbi:outer membrane lipoprotein LolB [Snodgrassella sp. CFCC 13594]|uniref:outer membrane lipoprotein LolB n=1 Tax=Snodgrassella sp. CFCC 13594 TaxID=1775559 RepID=UPI000831BECF|nr:outer membrane lipoprotein LolB [Snodgrassella sp. CFCC 13594]